MIQALALDIDGTITTSDRRIDLPAVNAIWKIEESNIPVCLATGNISCYVKTTSVLLGTSGPLISEDGGIVYEPSTEKEYILGDLEKINQGIELLKKEFTDIEHTRSSEKRKTGRTLERTFDVKKAEEIFSKNNLNLTAVDSGFAIHIKDPETNKGNALEKVASLLQLPLSDIAAMGDGANDKKMLETAGLSFAPANASPEAKEVSDYVTKSAYGKGVKEAVEKILEKN